MIRPMDINADENTIDTDTDDDLGFRLALDSSYESSLNGLIKGKE